MCTRYEGRTMSANSEAVTHMRVVGIVIVGRRNMLQVVGIYLSRKGCDAGESMMHVKKRRWWDPHPADICTRAKRYAFDSGGRERSHPEDIRVPNAMRLTQVGGKEPSSRHTRTKRYAFDSGGRERAIQQTYECQTLCV
jgi:hypothetical protein